jgi:hypothetical protein
MAIHRIPSTVLMLLGAATATEAQRVAITGTVRYDGPPVVTELLVANDARQYCGSTTSVQRSINRGGVGNVVVFLEGVGPVDMNGKPIELRNVNCDFQPAVQVAETGAKLTMVNDDPMLHVVQMYRSGLRVGEFEVFGAGHSRTDRRLLQGPGLIDVQCRWHKWMRSSIWVFDHPYYAVTAADGTFTLSLVPPGTYKISIWHSQLGVQTREITVGAKEVLPLAFVYRGIATQ